MSAARLCYRPGVTTYTTLIDTESLAAHLRDPRFAIVDCRFELAHPDSGERSYEQGHIPGAVYAHLDRDLSGVKTGTNGRHPLPSQDDLVATLGRLGIDNDTQVVAYDQDTGMFASRLWWLLRWLGHDAVAVLDGGLAAWEAEHRPMERGVIERAARQFVPHPREDMTVSAAEVLALAASPGARIVDARAPERYRGEVEPIDRVGGHIPGAVNHFYQWNLEHGRFRPPDALRVVLREAISGAAASDVVSYCGSGVTACHNILAMQHAGMPGARLYPGSWSEWTSDPERPVAQTPTAREGDRE
jgi:thiosulfate/3-mercaptopyruvate sulfurtransferase